MLQHTISIPKGMCRAASFLGIFNKLLVATLKILLAIQLFSPAPSTIYVLIQNESAHSMNIGAKTGSRKEFYLGAGRTHWII